MVTLSPNPENLVPDEAVQSPVLAKNGETIDTLAPEVSETTAPSPAVKNVSVVTEIGAETPAEHVVDLRSDQPDDETPLETSDPLTADADKDEKEFIIGIISK